MYKTISHPISYLPMIYLLTLILMTMTTQDYTIVDFEKGIDLSRWRIVDDVVMGGRSDGNFEIDDEGHGHYHGKVSLENNGGFSSLRYRPAAAIVVSSHTHIEVRVKGDGKRYQLRVKNSANEPQSYIQYIETDTDWQTMRVPIHEMYPTYRGRVLDMPNFAGETIGELAFLIGNKEPQSFSLQIDYVKLVTVGE